MFNRRNKEKSIHKKKHKYRLFIYSKKKEIKLYIEKYSFNEYQKFYSVKTVFVVLNLIIVFFVEIVDVGN